MVKKFTKSGILLLIGIVLFSLGVLALGAKSFLRTKVTREQNAAGQVTQAPEQSPQTDSQYWQTYTSPEYLFSIDHPRFLTPVEIWGQGGYLLFVRLEENNFSQGKGVAVGVSDRTLEEEIAAVKKEISQGTVARLINEQQTTIGGISAIRLDYAPVNPEEGEGRSIAILNNGRHSFSVSTVPEQINDVVVSLKFLDNFNGCKQLEAGGGMSDFLQTYCSGQVCSKQKTQDACEKLDVLEVKDSRLSETSKKDLVPDCVWDESKSASEHCRPRY